MTPPLHRIDRFAGRAMRAVATFCLAALFTLIFVNVVARTFSFAGFAWFDEVVQGLFAWMVFIGAAALWRDAGHFRVDWLSQKLGAGIAGSALTVFLALLSLGFLVAMTVYGADLTSRSRALTPILGLHTGLFYVVIPISGALMTVYSLRDLWVALGMPPTTRRSQ